MCYGTKPHFLRHGVPNLGVDSVVSGRTWAIQATKVQEVMVDSYSDATTCDGIFGYFWPSIQLVLCLIVQLPQLGCLALTIQLAK